MSNVSFPAKMLSSYDIGHRVQVITAEGAKITDTLVGINTYRRNNGTVFLFLTFENVTSTKLVTHPGSQAGVMVELEQYVKRVGK
jgi:hypothetical protein